MQGCIRLSLCNVYMYYNVVAAAAAAAAAAATVIGFLHGCLYNQSAYTINIIVL